jgi:hypothetical protein
MQINLGTSLSGLRQAIATSSVPADHSATHPDSFTGTDGAISGKLFTFTDIPLGYLESITVTFTISGEVDAGSGQYQSPKITGARITTPTFYQSYGQNVTGEMKKDSGSYGISLWFDSFTGTLGSKSFVINSTTHFDPSNASSNNRIFDNGSNPEANKTYNNADQRHTQDSNYTDDGFQFQFNYSDSDEDSLSPTISNVTIDVVYKEAPYEN